MMECEIGDIIATIALGLSIICVLFAFHKWKKQTDVRRTEFVKDLIYSIRVDEENRNMFYQVEYNKFSYTKEFHGSETEKKLDKLLTQYNYVCYLRTKNIINDDEFGFAKYQIYHILQNQNIQKYLHFIFHHSIRVQNKIDDTFSFTYLLRYGMNEGILNESFYDANNRYYKQNFTEKI